MNQEKKQQEYPSSSDQFAQRLHGSWNRSRKKKDKQSRLPNVALIIIALLLIGLSLWLLFS